MKKLLLCCMALIAAGTQLSNAQNCTVKINGNACIRNQLIANTNGQALSSLSWNLNGFSVFYADTVSSPASVSIVAGNYGTGTGAAQFSFPTGGIALDSAGNIYVADHGNNRVQKWAPGASSGVTVAGGNGYGSGANQLAGPKDVFVDNKGNVYVADNANARVQKWAPGAKNGVTVAGGNGSGSAANQLSGPSGVYVDAAGNVYVADVYNYRVQKWAPGAKKGVTVAGGNGYGDGPNQFYYPTDVYLDGAGNIYVADVFTDNSDFHRVQKWAPNAKTGTTVAGGPGVFGYLLAITVDAAGNLYTADNGISGTPISLVQKWAPGATKGVTVAGGPNNGWDQLKYPTGVALDKSGNLYVLAGVTAPKVQKYIPTNGVVNTRFTPTQPGIYTVQATYKIGCVATSTAVTVGTAPDQPQIAALNPNSSSLCAGGVDTFVVSNPEDNVTYLWKIPNGCSVIANKGDSVIISIPPRFSSGFLTVAASNTCGSSTRDSLKLQGKPAKPSIITGAATVSPGSIVTYSIKDLGDTYRWTVPAGAKIMSGQSTASIKVKWGTQSGNVNVFATNRCGISAKQQLFVSVTSGSNIITGNNVSDLKRLTSGSAVVFPNPVKDMASLVINAPTIGKYKITLHELTGKVLMYKEAQLVAGKSQLNIDMHAYAKGMYFIKITDANNGTQLLKLIKE